MSVQLSLRNSLSQANSLSQKNSFSKADSLRKKRTCFSSRLWFRAETRQDQIIILCRKCTYKTMEAKFDSPWSAVKEGPKCAVVAWSPSHSRKWSWTRSSSVALIGLASWAIESPNRLVINRAVQKGSSSSKFSLKEILRSACTQ